MHHDERSRTVPILLVEDDAEDIEIIRRAFQRAETDNPIHVVRDGQEAMEFLQRTGRHADASRAPRPGLILLDLDLPRLDGREVLARIKGDPRLRRIPVVVLTTSADQVDVSACYDRGANSFIAKPLDVGGLLAAVTTIGKYWLQTVQIPHAGATA